MDLPALAVRRRRRTARPRVRRLAARAGVLTVIAGAALLPSAAPAFASAPACATPPAAYTGTDPTVAALTQLNIDEDTNCAAQLAELVAVEADVTSNHADLAAIKADLDGTLSTQVTNWPSGGTGSSVTVTNWPATQQVSLDAGSQSFFDGEFGALHDDVWVLIGATVAAFGLAEVFRRVYP